MKSLTNRLFLSFSSFLFWGPALEAKCTFWKRFYNLCPHGNRYLNLGQEWEIEYGIWLRKDWRNQQRFSFYIEILQGEKYSTLYWKRKPRFMNEKQVIYVESPSLLTNSQAHWVIHIGVGIGVVRIDPYQNHGYTK